MKSKLEDEMEHNLYYVAGQMYAAHPRSKKINLFF